MIRNLAMMALLMLGTGASASGFCATLLHPSLAFDQTSALPDHTTAQAGCRTSLSTDGTTSLHCMWSFPYRADVATQSFDALLGQIIACGAKRVTLDQDVNHPDFYDLRQFSFENRTIGVSLKDKGALAKTLIFLTFSDMSPSR